MSDDARMAITGLAAVLAELDGHRREIAALRERIRIALTANGLRGDTGPEGARGEIGAAGPIGPLGPAGAQGPQGRDGQRGDTGPRGEAGASGQAGANGAPGPTGPAGPQGAVGPPGPVGPQGEPGLNWRGAWEASGEYEAGDAVSHAGSSWIAEAPRRWVAPAPGAGWGLLAARGAAGGSFVVGGGGDGGGAGPAGPQGETGAQGPAGTKGDTGDAGAPGAQGPAGAGVPAGATGAVQFNDGGTMAGAASVLVEGGLLRLPSVALPSVPAAGGVAVFGREIAGRMMPAFIGPSGLDSALQPLLARNKVAWANPVGNVTTLSLMGMAITAAGTATSAAWAATNLHTSMRRLDYLVTTAATTAVAGFRGGAQQYWRGNAAGRGGFLLVCRWAPATGVAVPTSRAFCGLRALTGAPTDINPSTMTNIIGMGWDSADTNVQMIRNDGGGVASKIDLGAAFPRPVADRTAVYEVMLFAPPNAAEVQYEVTDLVAGAVATGTLSTDIPAAVTGLNPYAYHSVGGTSSVVGITLMSLYVETDL